MSLPDWVWWILGMVATLGLFLSSILLIVTSNDGDPY